MVHYPNFLTFVKGFHYYSHEFCRDNYMKTTAKGDLAEGLIAEQWSKIWVMDLKRRYTVDFKVFGEKAQHPSDAEVDFLVTVK